MKKEKQLKDIPIKEILEQQQKWWNNKSLPYTYEVLGKKYGSEKLVYRKMEQLCEKEYLECGVSVRTAWLTEKGKKLLIKEMLNEYIEEWREISKRETTPFLPGHNKSKVDFDDGWKLAINRMLNDLEIKLRLYDQKTKEN